MQYLTPDLELKILSSAWSSKDHQTIVSTCKKWNIIVNTKDFCRRFIMPYYPIPFCSKLLMSFNFHGFLKDPPSLNVIFQEYYRNGDLYLTENEINPKYRFWLRLLLLDYGSLSFIQNDRFLYQLSFKLFLFVEVIEKLRSSPLTDKLVNDLINILKKFMTKNLYSEDIIELLIAEIQSLKDKSDVPNLYHKYKIDFWKDILPNENLYDISAYFRLNKIPAESIPVFRNYLTDLIYNRLIFPDYRYKLRNTGQFLGQLFLCPDLKHQVLYEVIDKGNVLLNEFYYSFIKIVIPHIDDQYMLAKIHKFVHKHMDLYLQRFFDLIGKQKYINNRALEVFETIRYDSFKSILSEWLFDYLYDLGFRCFDMHNFYIDKHALPRQYCEIFSREVLMLKNCSEGFDRIKSKCISIISSLNENDSYLSTFSSFDWTNLIKDVIILFGIQRIKIPRAAPIKFILSFIKPEIEINKLLKKCPYKISIDYDFKSDLYVYETIMLSFLMSRRINPSFNYLDLTKKISWKSILKDETYEQIKDIIPIDTDGKFCLLLKRILSEPCKDGCTSNYYSSYVIIALACYLSRSNPIHLRELYGISIVCRRCQYCKEKLSEYLKFFGEQFSIDDLLQSPDPPMSPQATPPKKRKAEEEETQ